MNFRIRGLFYLLLDSVLSTDKATESTHDIAFKKAKLLLKKPEDIPISQIARECSVSESGLRKIFGDKIGMSPTQFRLKEKFNQMRILSFCQGFIPFALRFETASPYAEPCSEWRRAMPECILSESTSSVE